MEFLWGAATSAHQIEGDNVHSDWWRWEQQGNVETGEVSGRATDHLRRWREDLRLAADLGLNSYRFSVEWARVEPEEGNWNADALAWYEDVVAECERLGLVPMVTLHHFTLPQWLAARGGLTSEHFVDRFAGFVRKVGRSFGGRVPLWCTLNEPVNLAVGAYLGRYMPPAVVRPKLASLALRNLLRAHVRAYDWLHGKKVERRGAFRDLPLMVGVAHNLIDFRPLRPGRLVERAATRAFRRFYNRAWLDAVTGHKQHFGVLGLVPYAPQVWEARGRRTADFIGVNYYTRVYVCFGPQKDEAEFVPARKNWPIGVRFSARGDRVSDLGWAIHPEGLMKILRFVGSYDIPIFVTENGIADADDSRRPEYLRAHLVEVARAIARGVDVRGYYHWSLLDNFEWIKGFPPRFGLYEVDYSTFERRPRASAAVYRDIVEKHRAVEGRRPDPDRILI